jgi:S-adenosylmethionine hydrolase
VTYVLTCIDAGQDVGWAHWGIWGQDGAVAYVSFLSDYGLADGFVAACHGVLLRATPGVTIIDVGHLVPPGDIRHGSMLLAQTVGYLPVGVHLAVVDPGVGTERRALALAAPGGFLVGPDNGLLMPAATALGGVHTAVELPVPESASATFHGRDVFAPAAAALAAGRALTDLGRRVEPASLARLHDPVARVFPAARPRPASQAEQAGTAGTDAVRGSGEKAEIETAEPAAPNAPELVDTPVAQDAPVKDAPVVLEAEVVLVDRFGNAQLAASSGLIASAGLTSGRTARLTVGGVTHLLRVGITFGSVALGETVLYVDSAGMAAVAVNGANAATTLGIGPGDIVRIDAT